MGQTTSKTPKTHKKNEKSTSKLFHAQTGSIWFQIGSYVVPTWFLRFSIVQMVVPTNLKVTYLFSCTCNVPRTRHAQASIEFKAGGHCRCYSPSHDPVVSQLQDQIARPGTIREAGSMPLAANCVCHSRSGLSSIRAGHRIYVWGMWGDKARLLEDRGHVFRSSLGAIWTPQDWHEMVSWIKLHDIPWRGHMLVPLLFRIEVAGILFRRNGLQDGSLHGSPTSSMDMLELPPSLIGRTSQTGFSSLSRACQGEDGGAWADCWTPPHAASTTP